LGLFDLLNPDCNDSLMSSLEHFQNVVLCGGEAGKYIVWELARWGQRVAVVEKGLIGGSCPTIACLPGKNVILVSREVDHGYRRRGSTSRQEESSTSRQEERERRPSRDRSDSENSRHRFLIFQEKGKRATF
jgi:pyruvate/2-oxoglutarate dehydrogenase complex dihydrolipoamide dehydrogenase (E3) component